MGKRGVVSLVQAGITTWDLNVTGLWNQFIGFNDPDVVNTYAAVNSNRQATEGILHQRYAVLNAVMQYDCNNFDKYGVCIQFAARATGFGTQNTGAGVLNASYRVADKFRIGAYLDYQVGQGYPTGMDFSLGGVQQSSNNATFGGYIGYSQNADDTGIQARVSGGYNPGQINVARSVLAGTEPGYGNAGLNAYYVYGTMGYGIKLSDGLIVTPYGGIQYTDVTRNSFTEKAYGTNLIYPLAYNSYYERLVTGSFGGKVKAMLSEKLGFETALGAQVDFMRSANAYSGYSAAPGLEVFGIAHGGAWNGVRPTGMAGMFYSPLPNHRISLNGYVSQQSWTTRTYATGLLGYQIAF